MNLRAARIVVTGGEGFLGQHITGRLVACGARRENISVPHRSTSDLRKWEQCRKVTKNADIVIHAAAAEGGIEYDKHHQGKVFFDNAIMGIQLMEAARLSGVSKFVTIGTAASYPEVVSVPTQERELWSGLPHPDMASYGIAKRLLDVQGRAYRGEYGFNSVYLILANLYGPGDRFDHRAHVVASIVRRVDLAIDSHSGTVQMWGSGRATRDFLYVVDAAEAISLATLNFNGVEPVNIGSGVETRISDVCDIVCNLLGYNGKIQWNKSRPEGVVRRHLDTGVASKSLGFKSVTGLEVGLKETIGWYLSEKRRGALAREETRSKPRPISNYQECGDDPQIA